MAIDLTILMRAANYVIQLRDPQTGGFIFAKGNKPTLMATAYAVHTLEFCGAIDLLSAKEKDAAVAFMMRCCRKDGSFRDPLFDPSSIVTQSHDEAYFDGETTCFAQNALDALDAPPPPKRVFPKHLLTSAGLREEFNSYDWRDPHLNSNRVMFWMAQFAHEVERHGRKELLTLMDVGLDWMDENQSPRTGLWSGPVPVSLSASMAATFHYTFFYSYRNRALLHLERIIDSCIELQKKDGLFSRGSEVGQTCLDYDALDLLAKASLITDYRRPDVIETFRKAAPVLLTLANDDGGFANLKERWQGAMHLPTPGLYHTGLKICSCDNMESNSFSTWFRLLAYTLCYQSDWIENIATLPVCFRRLPWLGYHNVKAIRHSYESIVSNPQLINIVTSKKNRTWLAQNFDRNLGKTFNRYMLTLPDSLRHFALKIHLSSQAPVDVRVSYRLIGQSYFVGSQSLKQDMVLGDNILFFLMGDEKIDPQILLEFSCQHGQTKIEKIEINSLLF